MTMDARPRLRAVDHVALVGLSAVLLLQTHVLRTRAAAGDEPAVRRPAAPAPRTVANCATDALAADFGEAVTALTLSQAAAGGGVVLYSVTTAGYPFTRPWLYSHTGAGTYDVVLFTMHERLRSGTLPVHHGRIAAGLALSRCLPAGTRIVYNDMDVTTRVSVIAGLASATTAAAERLFISYRPETGELRTNWFSFRAGAPAADRLLRAWWAAARDVFLQDQRSLTDLAAARAQVAASGVHNVSTRGTAFREVRETHCHSRVGGDAVTRRAACVRTNMLRDCRLEGRSYNHNTKAVEVTAAQ
jgi:hypothetical protein